MRASETTFPKKPRCVENCLNSPTIYVINPYSRVLSIACESAPELKLVQANFSVQNAELLRFA